MIMGGMGTRKVMGGKVMGTDLNGPKLSKSRQFFSNSVR